MFSCFNRILFGPKFSLCVINPFVILCGFSLYQVEIDVLCCTKTLFEKANEVYIGIQNFTLPLSYFTFGRIGTVISPSCGNQPCSDSDAPPSGDNKGKPPHGHCI